MKSFAIATVVASAAAVANAQLIYNQDTNTFTCTIPDGAYCAGDSLQTNIIVRCTDGVGQPGNCNDNLAGVPPIGVKTFAPCYQSSAVAADAACSWDGVAYPDHGDPYPVPGYSASSSASPTGYPPASSSEAPDGYPDYSTSEEVPTSTDYPTPTGYPTEYPPTTEYPTTEVPPPPYSSETPPPSEYPPPPSSTDCSTSLLTSYGTPTPYPTPTLTPYPTGTGSSSVYPTGSWTPTYSPTPPPFPGAASQVFISSSLALIPIAALFAMLF
jgi:hypothetical protein